MIPEAAGLSGSVSEGCTAKPNVRSGDAQTAAGEPPAGLESPVPPAGGAMGSDGSGSRILLVVRRVPIFALVAAFVLLLVLAQRFLAPRVVAGRSVTGEAQWIWAAPDRQGVVPLAFQVARDFELEAVPRKARIDVLADEEYVLYLNGVRVGGGRYRPGAVFDGYSVAPLLAAGPNRLLVELRSGPRVGGLLLRLSGDGGLDVVTGSEWRILLRRRDGDLDPATALEETRRPRVWGRPPIGRWRRPEPGPLLPLHGELVAGRKRLRPVRLRSGGVWRPVPVGKARRAVKSLSRGEAPTFDFGREVTAYAGLYFGNRRSIRALLNFGCEPTGLEAVPDDRAIGARGEIVWTAALPRRFRCMTVLAPAGVRRAFVQEVDEDLAAPLLISPRQVEGVFGIADPPQLVTPVEYEIRRELQGLPGLVVGQPG